MKTFAPIFAGQVENGKLELREKDIFQRYLQSIKGEVEVIVRKRKRRRSNQQNNYYWGAVIPLLCEHFGYDDEEMHEALKWEFLRKTEREKLPTVKSTASLSTIEFNNYIDKIVRWASEQGIIIPEPEQVDL